MVRAQPRETSAPPTVYSADVDSIIHPVSAEYMIQTMDRADREGATLVIFTLRTPGGLVDSTREIITHMLAARTPIAVFIGPSGTRAASAGFLLTIAADVAAMAPGTHIGAAHPVAGSGEKMDETMAKKVTEDLAAYARTLASRRHRNVMLAEQAVNDSRLPKRGVRRFAAAHRRRRGCPSLLQTRWTDGDAIPWRQLSSELRRRVPDRHELAAACSAPSPIPTSLHSPEPRNSD